MQCHKGWHTSLNSRSGQGSRAKGVYIVLGSTMTEVVLGNDASTAPQNEITARAAHGVVFFKPSSPGRDSCGSDAETYKRHVRSEAELFMCRGASASPAQALVPSRVKRVLDSCGWLQQRAGGNPLSVLRDSEEQPGAYGCVPQSLHPEVAKRSRRPTCTSSQPPGPTHEGGLGARRAEQEYLKRESVLWRKLLAFGGCQNILDIHWMEAENLPGDDG
ncbi:hypothetical protein B0H12DRAFT_1074330 [Mycena haematopus]|nr:hypothetical protein B0H12DRAFT_1074330 [Mycena haematopus]